MKQLQYKNTFWMNVCFVIALVLLDFLSFITDIDYVEHTLRHKIISFCIQLAVLTVPTITAIHLYKSNTFLLRKLALLGNWCGVVFTVLYLLVIVYEQPSMFMDIGFLIVVLVYCVFLVPFVINLKALKAS